MHYNTAIAFDLRGTRDRTAQRRAHALRSSESLVVNQFRQTSVEWLLECTYH